MNITKTASKNKKNEAVEVSCSELFIMLFRFKYFLKLVHEFCIFFLLIEWLNLENQIVLIFLLFLFLVCPEFKDWILTK